MSTFCEVRDFNAIIKSSSSSSHWKDITFPFLKKHAQWWIQDLQKGGGGLKILDLLSLLPHIYKINKTTRWEVVKNSASPKRPFFI